MEAAKTRISRTQARGFATLDDPLGSRLLDDAGQYRVEMNRAEARLCTAIGELILHRIDCAQSDGTEPNWEITATQVELAAALGMTERAMERMSQLALAVVTSHPYVHDRWKEGMISRRHAEVIVDALNPLLARSDTDPVRIDAAEEELVEYAIQHNPSEVRRKARSLVVRIDADAAVRRHREARRWRAVAVVPADDGMAELRLHLTAVDAVAAADRIAHIATILRADEGTSAQGGRSLTQIKADVARDLLLHGVIPVPVLAQPQRDRTSTGGCNDGANSQRSEGDTADVHHAGDSHAAIGSGIHARVTITVPALTLLGVGEDPAQLEGYGPIDKATALRIAAGATSWMRVLTHPITGAALYYDRNVYRPPIELARMIKHRDQTCRAPGCVRPAHQCEIDHTIDWQYGGPTNHHNLATLCRKHHMLKHNSRWTARLDADGTMHWTSPHGHCLTTHPATAFANVGPDASPSAGISTRARSGGPASPISAGEGSVSSPDERTREQGHHRRYPR